MPKRFGIAPYKLDALRIFPYADLGYFPYAHRIGPLLLLGHGRAVLDLALTYCRLALSTNNPVSVSRNIENAKRAFQAALSTERRLGIRPRDKAIIAEKSFRVESLLVELARRGTWIAN